MENERRGKELVRSSEVLVEEYPELGYPELDRRWRRR